MDVETFRPQKHTRKKTDMASACLVHMHEEVEAQIEALSIRPPIV